jgi:two-component system, chemotaxis family, chemotaxis protein CheY
LKSLVVDDEIICRKIFEKVLIRYGQCDTVKNGKDAIEAYKTSLDNGCPYQLMVLDIVMPDLHGGQVLKLIRELEKERGISEIDKLRVIITSATDTWFNREFVTKNLNCIYETYFIKSPDMEEFIEKIYDLGFILD